MTIKDDKMIKIQQQKKTFVLLQLINAKIKNIKTIRRREKKRILKEILVINVKLIQSKHGIQVIN